ncbi:MAG: hypothetical protein F3745_00215 [Nitrospinae bacterium]|nr:hypothetical protein [Nitrospinota bacterium]
MSDLSNTFTQSNLESQTVDQDNTCEEERAFQLNELILEKPSMLRDFTYDSENARNFDQANVNKAKVGVKELLKDALDKAKRQATDIKSKAQKEGYDSGYSEGFKKGEDAAREEFKPFLETIEGLISDLTSFRKGMYDKVEREMVEMVVSLAKKVIHFEFSTRDDAVQEMIHLAVKSVLDRESMVIKINPADKGYAESFRPELHHLFGEIKNITFEAHSGIERGGCVVETNFGVIDAQIDKLGEQMDRILNLAPALPEELSSAANEQAEELVEEDLESSADNNNLQDENSPEDSVDGQDPTQNKDDETEPPEDNN